MLFIGGAIAFVLLAAIAVFAFPVFSPIPYFPSNRRDMKEIVKALGLKNNQYIVDLGAGDGVVIFEAAHEALRHHFSTQFYAVEINPILVAIMIMRRFLHPNRKNIKIIRGNIFENRIYQRIRNSRNSGASGGEVLFYLYVSPWFLDKIHRQLKNCFGKFRVVSYFYPLPGKKPTKTVAGYHKIYTYG